MALVYCPECGTKVSDTASSCPYCGYRSSSENLPMVANKKPLAKFQWESEGDDQIFPFSTIQSDNLSTIFGKAENLSRIAPAFFEVIKAMFPKTLKVAEITPEIQKLIDSGIYRFMTDKSGEILPTIIGENGKIVAQVRLKDVTITPDLGLSIVNLQTQIALAQILKAIRDLQEAVANLHRELQDDRLALAESAWQQLEQATHISDSRVREQALLNILHGATDAKCPLFRAFAREKPFFEKQMNKGMFSKLFDLNAEKKGNENSCEIFDTLRAIILAVQVETTVHCLLGEQGAARESIKQFCDFIKENSLDNRDTLLTFNSFGSFEHSAYQMSLIDKIAALLGTEKTKQLTFQSAKALTLKREEKLPLLNAISLKKENHNE